MPEGPAGPSGPGKAIEPAGQDRLGGPDEAVAVSSAADPVERGGDAVAEVGLESRWIA